MHSNYEAIIIDDDPFALAMTKLLVSGRISNKNIRIFSSPATALQYLETEHELQLKKTGRRGIILTDLEMPGMHGAEFLDAFTRLPEETNEKYRVFVLSSIEDKLEIQRLHEKPGFEGFIPKPLTVEHFDKLLTQLADR